VTAEELVARLPDGIVGKRYLPHVHGFVRHAPHNVGRPQPTGKTVVVDVHRRGERALIQPVELSFNVASVARYDELKLYVRHDLRRDISERDALPVGKWLASVRKRGREDIDGVGMLVRYPRVDP
jgi:hypothetical protein